MISTRTLQVWADDDAAYERNRLVRLEQRAAYQRRYEAAVDALFRMGPNRRQHVQEVLRRLNKPGCLSGSFAFSETLEWLSKQGIRDANLLFEHDREHLAAMFAGADAEAPRSLAAAE